MSEVKAVADITIVDYSDGKNGYSILWNRASFSGAYNTGEAYICAKDITTNVLSDANGTVWFNGDVRTVPKGVVNPNTYIPYNKTIYIVLRLSSSSSTTGTVYLVWYNDSWKYSERELGASTAISDWEWVNNTDIVLGSFVEPGSEKAFVDCEIYDPPYTSKQVTTGDTSFQEASNAAKTATNYMKFNATDGLVISDIENNTLSKNVQILNDSINIRDSDTILASFGATQAVIGKTDTKHAVMNATDGFSVKNGSTTIANFGETATIGMEASSNLYLDSTGLNFRINGTTHARFGDTITLGRPGVDWFSTITSEGYTLKTPEDQVMFKCESGIVTVGDPDKWHANIEANEFDFMNGSITQAKFSGNNLTIGLSESNGATINLSTGNVFSISSLVDGGNSQIRSGPQLIVSSGGPIRLKSTPGYFDVTSDSMYNPSIRFYSSECANHHGTITTNTTNNNMLFSDSSLYRFDKSIYTNVNLKIGASDTDGTQAARLIVANYKDKKEHTIVGRQNDGLSTLLGCTFTGYTTNTYLRGNTCKLGSASGSTITSDERLKKDFSTLDRWDSFFDSLEPCAFKMKTGSSGRYHIGFKAQQVESALIENGLSTYDFAGFIKSAYNDSNIDDPSISEVYNEVGIKNGDDEYGLIYTEFTALNTYKIQKLQKENTELKNKVSSLEARIEALENLILKEE